ncbi:MAG: S-adenosylmethionine:tRNA ribosyltransferase-isomerase [Muribaculaceae bacterium]|nr:S-adenosylmethionine:tRNA ribosyltransferase-isomerase [Muribaculaceae bacterium]
MLHDNLRISEFDYPLPDDRIAGHPLADRDKCKLLVFGGDAKSPEEHVFAELPDLLPSDSMLVYNNTRVINARMRFRKGGDGALIEIFCLEPKTPVDYAENFASRGNVSWLCFVGNSKRWKSGSLTLPLVIDGRGVALSATRLDRIGNASVVEFSWQWAEGGGSELPTFASIIEAAGEIPIPPYLNRPTEESDSTDYQTVYSRIKGSVAAPTAGLHFTDAVLNAIDSRGIPRRELTLHVGAGTFQPVKEEDVTLHEMHSEFIAVPLSLIEELAVGDRRVIAVGTTSVRTLESLYHAGCLIASGRWTGEVPQWYPYEADHPHLPVRDALMAVANYLRENDLATFLASTRIIIAPGYEYKIVRGMVTNFHQPKSTLLLLVSAFIGPAWKEAYDYALAHGFRFLSYGDACLFLG